MDRARHEQPRPTGPGIGTESEAAGTPFGPYDLLQEIGRGAMGVVYRARQRDLERIVALKTINPQLLDSEMVERFVREGRSAARLGKHPNIVQVYDAGVIDGVPFLAMEFVHGVSLDALVRRDGPLDEQRVLEIARKVALALDHAHRRGIVHRDIKPGNVMIDGSGEPQLLDFGLAKDLTNQSLLSTEGSIIGTPAYMPPEQAQPGSAPVDRRSDVYALGALMHHALRGEPPFCGDSMVATIVKVLTQDPPPLSRLAGVSRDTEAIIDKAMEKDPKRRYQTALDMADDLSRVIAGEPPKVRPLGPLKRTWRRLRRNRKAVVALSALLIVFAMATGYLLWRTWERGAAILRRNRATELLGTLYLNEGAQFKIDLFERARKIDPTWGHAYFQLAVAYTDRGLELDPVDREAGKQMRLKAIEVLREGLRHGLGVQGVYQLANTYEELLDYPAAVRYFEQAAAMDPEGLFGMRAACAAAYLTGRFEEAIEFGTKVLNIATDDDLTYWRRGSAYLALGQAARAAADGMRAVALWEIEPEYHVLAAEALLDQGELGRSGDYALSARKINDRHPVVSAFLSLRALRDGDAQRALRLAERAVQEDAREPQVWVARAQAKLALGDAEGARADLKQALSRHAYDEDATALQRMLAQSSREWVARAREQGRLLAAARSAFERGLWRRAQQAAEAAVQEAGDGAEEVPARVLLVQVLLAQGAFARALEVIDKAPRSGPELEALRADVLLRLGRYKDAAQAVHAALSTTLQPARALLVRARLRLEAGRTELALVDTERVLRYDPLDARAREIRRSCRRAIRDVDGAAEDSSVLEWLGRS